MQQDYLLLALVVVCAIGSANWLWYANNANGTELVSTISRGNAKVALGLYDLVGVCGVVLLGYVVYKVAKGHSMMGGGSSCSM
jgi:sugar phosphate permease